ncbi:MAG TPA: MBL fold metallo-hydrolase [Candidatus Nitrosotenuis sp.]|jgi:phosphoribosyl 1,2-cyclic phosphate phosphodiesterase|nr:MBL fold metallo-hydrolase [Candidatus Nitrosotenuis sp.]
MKITILGSGASAGVPIITGEWGACDSQNSKNWRRRASVFVELGDYNLLIDASPDLRMQLLDAGINRIDGVLVTHAHADHIMGLDELRQIYLKHRQIIPIYADHQTLQALETTFGYAFRPQDPHYISFVSPHLITGPFELYGTTIIPFVQKHGNIESLGYRIGNFAYSTDFNMIPESSLKCLQNLDLWVVDCLRFEPHPTHIHFDGVMTLIEQLKPKRAILTHLTHWLDYDHLRSLLPSHIEPAYDGMVLEIPKHDIL